MGKGSGIRLLVYVLVSFGLAYSIDFWGYFSGFGLSRLGFSVLSGFRMFTPLVGVLVASLFFFGGRGRLLHAYGMSFHGLKVWHVLAALAIPYVVYVIGLGYLLLFGYPVVNPFPRLAASVHGFIPAQYLPVLIVAETLVAGLTINAIFAFGEEIGWRGLMQAELSSSINPYVVPLIVGIVWGLWHAPLILLYGYEYPYHRDLLGVALFTAFTISWSYILYDVRSWSGSVVPPSILHGTVNAVGGLELITGYVRDTAIGLPVGYLGVLAASTLSAIILVVRKLSGGYGEERYREILEGY